jgi:hypothetical protein
VEYEKIDLREVENGMVVTRDWKEQSTIGDGKTLINEY